MVTSSGSYTVPWHEERGLGTMEFWWRLLSHLINWQNVVPYTIDRQGYIMHVSTPSLRYHIMDRELPIPQVITRHITEEIRLDFLSHRAFSLAEVVYGRCI